MSMWRKLVKASRRLRAGRNPRRAPHFAQAELETVIAAGNSKLLSFGQAHQAVRRGNRFVSAASQRRLIADIFVDIAQAAGRDQHVHVYRFKLAVLTRAHLKAIQKDYREFVSHAMHYVRTGRNKTQAAKELNSGLKLDTDERKKLRQGILVLAANLKSKMNAETKTVYANAYRRGKAEGVRKLVLKGANPAVGETITGKDLKNLGEWQDFNDNATDGLVDDVMDGVDDVLDGMDPEDPDYDPDYDEVDFEDDMSDALTGEDYRLPLYAWSAFSVAESAQLSVFQDFNDERGDDSDESEWLYAWLTDGGDNVCDICEGYEAEDPKYLDEWPEEPGGVHVSCILPGNKVVCPDLVLAIKSFYKGGAVEITLSDGRCLTTTENHPILTPAGFVAAKFLRRGGYVLGAINSKGIPSVDANDDNVPSFIEEIFSTLQKRSLIPKMVAPAATKDFHGDGKGIKGDVQIVWANRFLWRYLEFQITKHFNKLCLKFSHMSKRPLTANSPAGLNNGTDDCISKRLMCSLSSLLPGGRGSLRGGTPLPFGDTSPRYCEAHQSLLNRRMMDTNLISNFMNTQAGNIKAFKIQKLCFRKVSTHVYDLQARVYPLYAVNGIFVHNCHCDLEPIPPEGDQMS